MQEALIEELKDSFTLAANQSSEANGRGYKIHFSAPWRDNGLNVSQYQVQLCGIDPLTGKDVESNAIIGRFNFSTTSAQTGVLHYHGRFLLRCTAHLKDGRVIPFREQEIFLDYPQNRPYIQYKVSSYGGFKQITLKSNCWAYCKDKIWLYFDGHFQRLQLPAQRVNTQYFYLPTSADVEVRVIDDLIQVRKDM